MKYWIFHPGSRDAGTGFALLFLRVTVGCAMLFGHGWSKLLGFLDFKDSWPVPSLPLLNHLSPAASLLATIVAEVLASALIVLGFATRPAALLLAFTMAVAAFQIHAAAPLFMGPDSPISKEPALLYGIFYVVLLIAGSGRFSCDAQIIEEKRRLFR